MADQIIVKSEVLSADGASIVLCLPDCALPSSVTDVWQSK